MLRFWRLVTKATKNFKSDGVYKNLANKEEKLCYIPSHRFLVIMRAVKEKELSIKIIIDTEYIESNIKKYKIPKNAFSSKEFLFETYRDGLKRLLLPSIEREVMQIVKEKADIKATEVFGKNLSWLLLTSPLVNEIILGVGEATLRDIVDELQKPGFDIRAEQPFIPFKEGITDIEQLKEGDRVSGVVRNITEFGAFVDIGLKNDGMIHISKMADKRVSHPLEVLALNQFLPVIEVISIDLKMGRVGLSLQGI